ncbi:MAG: SET domain-containing protein [Sphingobacteriales bacterium]|nr:MAG: SET domain-containing protein [Sphingobacteriales bacterium]
MIHPDLFIQQTPAKGRGVFTASNLPAEEEIELSPVIVMPGKDRPYLDKTLLHDYIFEWNPEDEKGCCMALGWVPVYNHSYGSNCEYEMDYEAQTISIKTVRPITAGEELTINYNGDWNDETPVWFDVAPS